MPGSSSVRDLSDLLRRVFGHGSFRAHQQEVCEAAASGRDVLLVMPTGAGKSLCYQLPALARQGTALVVSPLIALIDDQAGKLSALGLRVARIHSGLSREDSRQGCRDYLAGELDFLFIAPERMRVPGFPEMLAKRKPGLVAIDEAHCISQWGHDFRPDYRTLGAHLQALRPAPVIALTATATPAVQRDIATQLNLDNPAIFITGFRRENLAVEVMELSKPQRADYTVKLLADESARPAIVYAASRKAAEELAAKLGTKYPAAAYHAGLEASVRERVQTAFLGGKLDVVVATVAFGMGVDKANVRTVVHVALPGSVEAFYQEIGRAGRDGLPSRTVLLYSFADRKLQEFFLERNYPAKSDLERVAAKLSDEFCAVEDLQRALKLDRETLDRSIEKLVAQGVATTDMSGMVRGTGERGWQNGYEAQVAFRRDQIDRIMAFAEGHTCRMAALVRHFGEPLAHGNACGRCDVCRPGGGADSAMHQPGKREREDLREILSAVAKRGTSTGKLFTDLALTRDRKAFDGMLDALARAGLLSIANDTFRNPEGRDVTYRKVSITHEGLTPDDATLDTVWLRDETAAPKSRSNNKAKAGAKQAAAVDLTEEQQGLEKGLREWRKKTAEKSGKPAFLIFGDGVLKSIAAAEPKTLQVLAQVSGIGEDKLERYGAAVIEICRSGGAGVSTAEDTHRPPTVKKPAVVPAVRKQIPLPVARSEREPRIASVSAPSAVVSAQRPPAVPVRVAPQELNGTQEAVAARLREWRREQAKEAGLPTFFIFSDSVLREIAVAEPRDIAALRNVRGFGPEKLDKFGADVLEVCRA
ncbi:MAG TPA: RecQ family ATP-dependent DNA helicase [Acidobacteriaceae bacterium]|jgi:ATP-dependent DNA helicase RecQ